AARRRLESISIVAVMARSDIDPPALITTTSRAPVPALPTQRRPGGQSRRLSAQHAQRLTRPSAVHHLPPLAKHPATARTTRRPCHQRQPPLRRRRSSAPRLQLRRMRRGLGLPLLLPRLEAHLT